ncbi:MAG TPA: toll/interleukin-1 receptor domain-containing protein [Pyrinomonadaceae bacterium]|nr:toll/interleukin-1 receptor domain-containing protein [Pyrinomonadaceae bacterium]
MSRNQIFISYSHKDKDCLERLQVNLKPFLRGSSIVAWDDTKIQPGDDWKKAIDQALSTTKIAVLLVSSDFLASDFIYQEELPYLLKAAGEQEVRVIPVSVRPSAWKTAPFQANQWANEPDRPLYNLDRSDREKALVKISEIIASFLADVPTAPRPVVNGGADTVATVTRSAEEGLRALVELMHNAEVRAQVATFEAVFAASSRQIEVLGYYKDLHDLLHTLQFSCYNYLMNIVRSAKREPDDLSIWENVVEYERALEKIINGLRKASDQTSVSLTALPWIQKLLSDLKQVFQAIDQNNAERIAIAINPIQRILATEPSRINDRLAAAADALQLPMLVAALVGVRKCVDGSGVNSSAVKKFGDGVDAICGLKANLESLIDSHNRWQEIDIILRRIDGNMANDYGELQYSWPDLKQLTESLCKDDEEEWAQLLVREIQKLDAALAAADERKIRQSFQSFRTRSNYRFYDVDFSLKDLCDKLRRVGEPLTTVWEMIR